MCCKDKNISSSEFSIEKPKHEQGSCCKGESKKHEHSDDHECCGGEGKGDCGCKNNGEGKGDCGCGNH